MTNQEYIIAVLTDQIDDCGESREACVYYHISCPYHLGDRRCMCYSDEYREGKIQGDMLKDRKEITRELCVECKEKWLESEVDE